MSARAAAVLWLAAALGVGAGPVAAQGPGLRPLPPPAPEAERPHRAGELECGNCHLGKHRGVVLMYLGMGGRGTPMIPSHMFQVRVECAACHVVPEETEARAEIVGQTFRPTEQACLGCHGEKYRGMLARWSTTLTRMQAILAPKLAGAKAALDRADPKHPKLARARELVADAESNMRYVRLARGVHNVFYAADLLKLANQWLDSAFVALGRTPPTNADALVRGGYCAVLCHEQAGVPQLATVTFEKQRLPHVRHVTELGAVCTDCHSAEQHKAVTATAQTCRSCHHGPQNERCESCHRAQSAFYRGTLETTLASVAPNVMASVVGCTGCHDWSAKHSRAAVDKKCLDCHDEAYGAFTELWTTGLDEELAAASATLKQAERALAGARRAGRKAPEAERLVKEAREALALVRRARGAHNPEAAEALLAAAKARAEEAARLARR